MTRTGTQGRNLITAPTPRYPGSTPTTNGEYVTVGGHGKDRRNFYISTTVVFLFLQLTVAVILLVFTTRAHSTPAKVVFCLLASIYAGLALVCLRADRRARREAEASSTRPDLASLRTARFNEGWNALSHVARSTTSDFEEELELRIIIGSSGAGDQVVERHRTTPFYPLPCRIVRLTSPIGESRPLRPKVVGEDSSVKPTPTLLAGSDNRQVAIVFTPSLRSTYTWSVAYHVPNMWDPLRDNGRDRLRYRVGLNGNGSISSYLSRFTVIFVCPEDTRYVVNVPSGEGYIEEAKTVSGLREISWTCENLRSAPSSTGTPPSDSRYVEYCWDIKMEPEREPSMDDDGDNDELDRSMKLGIC